MIRALASLLVALTLLLPHGGAVAQSGARVVSTVSWVEEWDPAAQRWVRIEESAGTAASLAYVHPAASSRPAAMLPPLAQYGPFRVLDATRAALVGSTDIASPRHFDAMLRDYPGIAVLEMIDAPGTSHDLANLALGRRIRAAGLATHVPAGGSVRSGAVELFLAGRHHRIDDGASFAVHSWLDSRGLEPRHFAENASENRLYLDYYVEMGMTPDHARAFYALTNSVPHSGVLWLDAVTMQRWIAPLVDARPTEPRPEALSGEAEWVWQSVVQPATQWALPGAPPVLAYADLAPVLLARLDSPAVFP